MSEKLDPVKGADAFAFLSARTARASFDALDGLLEQARREAEQAFDSGVMVGLMYAARQLAAGQDPEETIRAALKTDMSVFREFKATRPSNERDADVVVHRKRTL